MGNAERVEKRSHHRPLVLEVISDDQARRQQIGHLDQAPEVLGALVDRQRHDALGAELDLPRDQGHRFSLFEGGLLIGPEGAGGGHAQV